MVTYHAIRFNIIRAEKMIADYNAAIDIWTYHKDPQKAKSAVARLETLKVSACSNLTYWQGMLADWVQS